MKSAVLALIIVFRVLTAGAGHAAVVYVNGNATGSQNGASWETAYQNLQSALSAAVSGDEIWVAVGIYTPGAEKTDAFSLKEGVKVYGGFSGTESSREQRDWIAHPTLLSGDIGQLDVVTDNCYHVFYHLNLNLTEETLLDGFVITGGNAADNGGGMYNCNSSPSISNCVFRDNSAAWSGGAMYNYGVSINITGCSFLDNTCGSGGAGVYNESSTTAIADCTFVGNRTGDYGEGGAIRNFRAAAAIRNCGFIANAAGDQYGLGGGICNKDSSGLVTVTNSFFSANAAMQGGGLYGSNQRITHCVFWKNQADYSGGGVAGTGETFVSNSIFWENQLDQIGGSASVSFSDIQNGFSGEGNIDQDPLFQNAAGSDGIAGTEDDDFHLLPDSPCVDAGGNGAWDMPDTDFENEERIVDGDQDTVLLADMGVDEVGGAGGYTAPSAVWVDDEWQGAKAGDQVQTHCFGVDAFSRIQHAINVLAVPGTITVSNGTYMENLVMKSGVAIDGENKTAVAIDGGGAGPVVSAIDVDHTASIRHVTLTNGKSSTGGGLHLENSSMKLSECIIAQNNAYYVYSSDDRYYPDRQKARGGGAYIKNGSPWFEDCVFSDNAATSANGQETLGGGIYCENATPLLYDCVLKGNYTQHDGGGMYSLDATPFLNGCTFKGNHVLGDGGGVYCRSSNLRFEGGDFVENSAAGAGGAVYGSASQLYLIYGLVDENTAHKGGGFYAEEGTLTIKESLFQNNLAKSGTSASGKAGALMAIDATAFYSYCRFSNNRAVTKAGVPSCNYAMAGALYADGGDQTLSHCEFHNNQAGIGGGIAIKDDIEVYACVLTGNTADFGGGAYVNGETSLANTVFHGNSAGNGGGAVIDDGDAVLANCTFYGNEATKGPGLYCGFINSAAANSIRIANTILWNGGGEIYNTGDAVIDVTFSAVQGGMSGQGNIDQDPLVQDPDAGNVRLLTDSPCIDAGNDGATGAPEKDLDGEPRPMPGVVSGPSIIDIGADEYSDPSSLCILDSSPSGPVVGTVDHIDITFSTPVDPATFTAADIFISLMDGSTLEPTLALLDSVDNREVYRIGFAPQTSGMVMMVITPNILGLNGSLLNQDHDLTAGESGDDAFECYVNIMFNESAFLKGDINADGAVDLQDAVLALNVLGRNPDASVRPDFVSSAIDVNGDNRVGAEELAYILRVAGGLISAGSAAP